MIISLEKFGALMYRHFNTYQWMLKHRKKAARKERNRKKWYARYGGGLTEAIQKPNPFISLIPETDGFSGKHIPVPLSY